MQIIISDGVQRQTDPELLDTMVRLYRKYHQGEYLYIIDIRSDGIHLQGHASRVHSRPATSRFTGIIWIQDNGDGSIKFMLPGEYNAG